MKKVIFVVSIVAVIAIAAVLLGNRASQDTVLAKEIDTLLEQGATQIELTEVTVFKWIGAGLFGPYTTDEVIEESMGIKFQGDNAGIDMLDDRFLWVFANEKHAVKTVVLSRKYGNYIVNEPPLR